MVLLIFKDFLSMYSTGKITPSVYKKKLVYDKIWSNLKTTNISTYYIIQFGNKQLYV